MNAGSATTTASPNPQSAVDQGRRALGKSQAQSENHACEREPVGDPVRAQSVQHPTARTATSPALSQGPC